MIYRRQRGAISPPKAARRGRDRGPPSISETWPADSGRLSEQRLPGGKPFSFFNGSIAAITELVPRQGGPRSVGGPGGGGLWSSVYAPLSWPGHVIASCYVFLLCESPRSSSFCLLVLSAQTLKSTVLQLFICCWLLPHYHHPPLGHGGSRGNCRFAVVHPGLWLPVTELCLHWAPLLTSTLTSSEGSHMLILLFLSQSPGGHRTGPGSTRVRLWVHASWIKSPLFCSSVRPHTAVGVSGFSPSV